LFLPAYVMGKKRKETKETGEVDPLSSPFRIFFYIGNPDEVLPPFSPRLYPSLAGRIADSPNKGCLMNLIPVYAIPAIT